MSAEQQPVIIWFRRDLRLSDNPALIEACKTGCPVICLYIFEKDRARDLGKASLWWLHHSLEKLSKSLNKLGCSLTLKKGQASTILTEICEQHHVQTVYWNRRYEADAIERDTGIKKNLTSKGVEVTSYRANLLSEPWTVETKTGGYYKVFTPYWRNAKASIQDIEPLKSPTSINAFKGNIETDILDDWNLLPTKPNWGKKMNPFWNIGPEGAHKALTNFVEGPISYVLLFHNPKLASKNFKADFDNFEWEENTDALKAWQKGMTGYPFVDAGMRQLWQTGWQHNRVRMVTASFLIKHLLIDWREGEKWFHDTLVDADPASNAASWQWVAGSGADASPYFRIFNPFTQGEKFDPEGDYVREFIPELAKLPKKYIHRPWEAPQNILDYANVKLGETYPKPIIDHKFARERALAAYKKSRS